MPPIRLVLLLAALLAAPPATALAQSSDEGEDGGAAVEIRSVSTIAPLRTDNGSRAEDVYRALIPDPLRMPREPAVGVWLADLAFGANRGRPADDATHWLEGAVQIRVVHRDAGGKETEGWYPIHYPVTAEFWFNAGRYVGLPKRHASAAIAPEGQGWSATATPRDTTGGPSFQMDWQPAGGGDEATLTRAFKVSTDPLLVLNAPLQGPDLMRVKYDIGKPGLVVPGGPPAYDPATSKPEGGVVRLQVRDDLDLLQERDLPQLFPAGASMDDLIDVDQAVPGTHAHYAVALGSTSEKIGEGGYRRDGAQQRPPSSGGAAQRRGAARACRSRRVITLRYRAVPGARVRRVRVTVNGRRARSRALRDRRVRISLRGMPAGRQRVRVVAVQSRGIVTRTDRAFRTCAKRSRG